MSKNQTIYKKITIPFDKGGKTFYDGKFYIEKEDFFGVMIGDKPVFLNKDYATEVEPTDDAFSCVLPLWLIQSKEIELFIDTTDEPSLFG